MKNRVLYFCAFKVSIYQDYFTLTKVLIDWIKKSLNIFPFSRDLETYSEAHLAGCNLVDPDLNGGELNIKIPSKSTKKTTSVNPIRE